MPSGNANLKRIGEVCGRFAEKLGYELCDTALDKEPAGKYLRVYIDRDGGVTLDDCERYHRAVQPALESFDYDFLEVCSPGIDRPLKTQRDIEKSIGLMVEARLYKPVEGRKAVQGLLLSMNENEVILREDPADDLKRTAFPRSAVAQVRLVPDLSALDDDTE